MKEENMSENDNKFKAGDAIYTKVHPKVKMIVRRYISRIYYCSFADDPEKKELVLFEREIV